MCNSVKLYQGHTTTSHNKSRVFLSLATLHKIFKCQNIWADTLKILVLVYSLFFQMESLCKCYPISLFHLILTMYKISSFQFSGIIQYPISHNHSEETDSTGFWWLTQLLLFNTASAREKQAVSRGITLFFWTPVTFHQLKKPFDKVKKCKTHHFFLLLNKILWSVIMF